MTCRSRTAARRRLRLGRPGRRLARVDGSSRAPLRRADGFSRPSAAAPRIRRRAGLLDQLFGVLRPAKSKARQLSKTPEGASSKVSRLQRRMELAGWTDPEAAGYYALAETVCPIVCGLLPLALMGTRAGCWRIIAAVLGYLVPDVVLTRATRRHQKAIQNGLPDAIDLIVVCVEAGSSLDQAIMRASEELRDRAARARAGAAHGHQRNPRRQAAARSVPGSGASARRSKTSGRW